MLIILVNYYRWFVYAKFNEVAFQTTLIRIDALMFGCLLRIFELEIRQWVNKYGYIFSNTLMLTAIWVFSWFVITGFNQSLWYNYTLAYIASGCLVVSGLFSKSVINKVLSLKQLVWIGKQSYGMYVWHYIMVFPVLCLQPRFGTLTTVIIYIFASVMAGALSTMTYERFFLNIRDKLIP